MGNILQPIASEMWGPKKASTEHSALKVFVVLKCIFQHLSDSELRKARHVDRNWNLAAMSELVLRGFHLPAIKLYSFSSNESRNRNCDYNWYLDFENSRRRLWSDLYGDDCPILDFRDLNFSYPEETDEFLGIFQSPWLASVTNLTLSMHSERTPDLINRFLPCFPNLHNFCCSVKPDVVAVDGFIDLSNINFNLDDDTNEVAPQLVPPESAEVNQRQVYSSLRSVKICIEEICDFPWLLLNSFPELKKLELQFCDPTSLIKCSSELTTGNMSREIEILQITLIHKPDLEEQIKETLLHSETFAIANAKLCNHFRPRNSLGVLSMIPASHFFVFLNELQPIMTRQVEFEIAAPCYAGMEYTGYVFMYYLIPGVGFKFSDLKQLQFHFLQYRPSNPNTPTRFLGRQFLNLDRTTLRKLDVIATRTVPTTVEVQPDGILLPFAHYSLYLVHEFELENITELVFEMSHWFDCLVLMAPVPINLRKLVLRGNALFSTANPIISGWFLFPGLNWPDYPKGDYFERLKVITTRGYIGLPGIQSLEVFCLERIKLLYSPLLAPKIRRMPRLKSIHLDSECNKLVKKSPRSWSPKWPSVVEHVQILTK